MMDWRKNSFPLLSYKLPRFVKRTRVLRSQKREILVCTGKWFTSLKKKAWAAPYFFFLFFSSRRDGISRRGAVIDIYICCVYAQCCHLYGRPSQGTIANNSSGSQRNSWSSATGIEREDITFLRPHDIWLSSVCHLIRFTCESMTLQILIEGAI